MFDLEMEKLIVLQNEPNTCVLRNCVSPMHRICSQSGTSYSGENLLSIKDIFMNSLKILIYIRIMISEVKKVI